MRGPSSMSTTAMRSTRTICRGSTSEVREEERALPESGRAGVGLYSRRSPFMDAHRGRNRRDEPGLDRLCARRDARRWPMDARADTGRHRGGWPHPSHRDRSHRGRRSNRYGAVAGMIVLGVDPGKRSPGWAIVEPRLKVLYLHEAGSGPIHSDRMHALLSRRFGNESIHLLAIEDQASHFGSALIAGAFERGRWTAIAEYIGVPVVVVNPTKWQEHFFPGAQGALRSAGRKRACPKPTVPPGKRKPRPCGECGTCEQNRVIAAQKRAGSKSWKQHYTIRAREFFGQMDLTDDSAAACWVAAYAINDYLERII